MIVSDITQTGQKRRALPYAPVLTLSGLVLCGSANINERSQRGDRDSELVSVIRDTDMIDG